MTRPAERIARATESELRMLGFDAAHIAAFASMMALALLAEPETTPAGEAAEGLQHLARQLSDRLLTLADPNA